MYKENTWESVNEEVVDVQNSFALILVLKSRSEHPLMSTSPRI